MSISADRGRLKTWMDQEMDTKSVAGFQAGPGIERLLVKFDATELRIALKELLSKVDLDGDYSEHGFGVVSLTSRPGETGESANDRSGLYWSRDGSYHEAAHEERVDEAAYSELVPAAKGTYFEHVHDELSARFTVGRMRVLSKEIYNCNSWHRDPEPRVHVPIISNPGSLFVLNHHCTHLPADGSAYFTDTRGYHMAMNGGNEPRVHLVAAVAG